MPINILGIESSCDDTAASILTDGEVKSNVIANQNVHRLYGGVIPELASRAHLQNIIPVVTQALYQANIDKKELHAVAYTQGPGLMGSLLVGNAFAKSISMALNIPLIEVNHMQAHLLVHFVKNPKKNPPQFPFLGLTISGGHTQLILVRDYFKMELLGETLDDAVGEAFDKTGKMLGLSYPAGPEIDRLAQKGIPIHPIAKPKIEGLNFSFSGLKTSVLYYLQKQQQKDPSFIQKNINNLCASIQEKIVTILIEKIELAVHKTNVTRIVLGGGVSANKGLRHALKEHPSWDVHLPELQYTTDNAAMIAMVGYLKYGRQNFSDLSSHAQSRFPL